MEIPKALAEKLNLRVGVRAGLVFTTHCGRFGRGQKSRMWVVVAVGERVQVVPGTTNGTDINQERGALSVPGDGSPVRRATWWLPDHAEWWNPDLPSQRVEDHPWVGQLPDDTLLDLRVRLGHGGE